MKRNETTWITTQSGEHFSTQHRHHHHHHQIEISSQISQFLQSIVINWLIASTKRFIKSNSRDPLRAWRGSEDPRHRSSPSDVCSQIRKVLIFRLNKNIGNKLLFLKRKRSDHPSSAWATHVVLNIIQFFFFSTSLDFLYFSLLVSLSLLSSSRLSLPLVLHWIKNKLWSISTK